MKGEGRRGSVRCVRCAVVPLPPTPYPVPGQGADGERQCIRDILVVSGWRRNRHVDSLLPPCSTSLRELEQGGTRGERRTTLGPATNPSRLVWRQSAQSLRRADCICLGVRRDVLHRGVWGALSPERTRCVRTRSGPAPHGVSRSHLVRTRALCAHSTRSTYSAVSGPMPGGAGQVTSPPATSISGCVMVTPVAQSSQVSVQVMRGSALRPSAPVR